MEDDSRRQVRDTGAGSVRTKDQDCPLEMRQNPSGFFGRADGNRVDPQLARDARQELVCEPVAVSFRDRNHAPGMLMQDTCQVGKPARGINVQRELGLQGVLRDSGRQPAQFLNGFGGIELLQVMDR